MNKTGRTAFSLVALHIAYQSLVQGISFDKNECSEKYAADEKSPACPQYKDKFKKMS